MTIAGNQGQNDYPAPDNYPVSSFRSPVPPPDVDPDAGDLLYVAYSPFWTEVLEGALMQLMNPATWQGEHDDVITALNRSNNLMVLLQQPVTPPTEQTPAPYWDDDADVDDQAEPDVQPWYGSVVDPTVDPDHLTLVENIIIWSFTGALAVATWEIRAAPAILFHTIAPRFVLAMRRGDAGEIIRILVDGQDAARVDTTPYAVDEVINVPILPDPAVTTGHDIMIVQVS